MIDSSLIDNGIALSKEVNESFWLTQEDLSFLFKNAPGSKELFNVLYEADLSLARKRLLSRIAASSWLDAKLLYDLCLAFTADYGFKIVENPTGISRFKFVDISRFIIDFYERGTGIVNFETVKFPGTNGKMEEEFFLHLTDPIVSLKSRKTAIDIARRTNVVFPYSKLNCIVESSLVPLDESAYQLRNAFMKAGEDELEVKSHPFSKADVWKVFDNIIKEDKLLDSKDRKEDRC